MATTTSSKGLPPGRHGRSQCPGPIVVHRSTNHLARAHVFGEIRAGSNATAACTTAQQLATRRCHLRNRKLLLPKSSTLLASIGIVAWISPQEVKHMDPRRGVKTSASTRKPLLTANTTNSKAHADSLDSSATPSSSSAWTELMSTNCRKRTAYRTCHEENMNKTRQMDRRAHTHTHPLSGHLQLPWLLLVVLFLFPPWIDWHLTEKLCSQDQPRCICGQLITSRISHGQIRCSPGCAQCSAAPPCLPCSTAFSSLLLLPAGLLCDSVLALCVLSPSLSRSLLSLLLCCCVCCACVCACV